MKLRNLISFALVGWMKLHPYTYDKPSPQPAHALLTAYVANFNVTTLGLTLKESMQSYGIDLEIED